MDNRAQDVLSQDGNLAEEVNESLGTERMPEAEAQETENANVPVHSLHKRLKQQERAHQREMREMQARMAQMQQNQYREPQAQPDQNSYNPNMSVAEQIQQGVRLTLAQMEEERRRAKDAENHAKVQKEYGALQKHLDVMSDKYEDFDDVVHGPDVPFSDQMRDAALFLPKKGSGSAGEVLYHLGKNREELERISRLHPLDQASEMVKLSHALISGGEAKGTQAARPLGQIKSNPVTNTYAVTDKTTPAEIRARMKAGKFK